MFIVKWQSSDFDTYTQARDYIDTAIIPLIPVTWEREMKSLISMGEYTTTLSEELERQLTGRLFLFPPLTYLKSETKDERIARLYSWKGQVNEQGLQYVFFITSDPTWNSVDDSIIILPSIPLEHMEPKYKKEIIGEQMNELLKIVTKKWQETV
jgi:hypothetical protein